MRLIRKAVANPALVIGILLLAVILGLTAAAGQIYPTNPLNMVYRPFLEPGADLRWPLGTDSMGRDILAGILYGGRVSVLVGIVSTLIGLVIGLLVGSIAGYAGGRTDRLLVRVIEIFQTFPPFLLVIVLLAIFQPTIATITLSIGLVSWPAIARIVRSEFRVLKNLDFVQAARAAGYGDFSIATGQILPNAIAPIIVTSSVMVASAILIESALSFLGLGDPNTVSWGSMIGSGRDQLRTAWYVITLPGLAIVVTVLSLNLLTDGLTRALNPRKD
jgi:peptide/nickel transport system permease protein